MFDLIVFIVLNIFGYKFLGYWFIIIELVLFFIFLIWLWWKKYRPVFNTTNLFTGPPGTGKTKLMVDVAVQRYRSQLRNYYIKSFVFKMFNYIVPKRWKKGPLEKPLFYSNIPIKLSRKKYSRVLTSDIVLLQKRMPYGSVVVIDELSELVNNQDWANVYARFNVNEFIRFIRHYTMGGFIFMADQSSDDVLVQIRRRVGKVYNMMSFRKIPFIKIGIVNIRHLSISEDIKVVETGQAENLDNTSWIPLFFYRKRYDTYAYSGRVVNMEIEYSKEFKKMKTNYLLGIPFLKVKGPSYLEPKTLKED